MWRLFQIRFLAVGMLMMPLVIEATDVQAQEWTWKDHSGKTRTRAELDVILGKHELWVKSSHKSGRRADLSNADLTDANFETRNLSGADLDGAVLSANLFRTDLSGARLTHANLAAANLMEANLSNAEISFANLSRANLAGANLKGATVDYTDLSDAILSEVHLSGVNLLSVNLANTMFEPQSLPEVRGMASAEGLELLQYLENPDALFMLRKMFADAGFRDQERQVTYAIKRHEAESSWETCKYRGAGDKPRPMLWSPDSNLANCTSYVLNRVFFDLTSQYGMNPGRPLALGIALWLLCSFLYWVFIYTPGESGLYRIDAPVIRENSATQQDSPTSSVEKIGPESTTGRWRIKRLIAFVLHGGRVLRVCMFFSLMSALNIGFRDLNFGRWVRLLTRQEFDIKAVGWARVIAGWQSLISVGLIALSVLTYFGRPFG